MDNSSDLSYNQGQPWDSLNRVSLCSDPSRGHLSEKPAWFGGFLLFSWANGLSLR